MSKPGDPPPAADGDYKVGKNRPPRHTQFRKGVSPNPSGRPKSKNSVKAQVAKLLVRKISVPVDGVRRMLSVQETILLAVCNSALKGDLRAAAFLFNLQESAGGQRSESIDPASLASFDQTTMLRYMKNALAGDDASLPSEIQGEPGCH